MLELKNINIIQTANDRKLIENLDFTLNRGDKAVVIGEEGNGKSTLLKLIHDASSVADYCQYAGRIVKKGRTAYLPQSLPAEYLDTSLAQFFRDADLTPHAKLMAVLGLSADFATSSRPISTLSGGERIKIQLMKIMADEPDILLLDEPTNDIDLEALEWMERFIKHCEQPVMYISHDETLIENTAGVIIHIEQLARKTKNKITVARCGYGEYVKTRNLTYDKQMMVAKKQRSEHKAQMERWRQIHDKVEREQRGIDKADRDAAGRMLKKKMKSVLTTGKRLERESGDFLDIPQMEQSILTHFDPEIKIPRGKVVLSLALPELRAGGKILAGPVSLSVSGPERVGIIGKNGAGKTTLLREVWEALKDRRDITAAYMPQDYGEALDYDISAVDFLAPGADKQSVTRARSHLGSMKFTESESLGKTGRLSGGQKAKVLFLNMVLINADVLILDEPTRNFSPLSAPEIRKVLAAFGGAIISVSHDRKYLEEVCDKIYSLDRGGLKQVRSII